MRVLEGEIITTYTMGKNKKHRLRKSKENEGGSDTSDEGAAAPAGCPHINKSVNFAAMKKAILKNNCGECAACNKENKSSNKESTIGATAVTTETEDLVDHETTIWVCLQCGNQGCDRNSKEKHALKHYETPHSSMHCVTVNLTTWACWCYVCDDDVLVENSKRIQECVEFLRKQSGLPRSDQISSSARRPLAVSNTLQPKVEPSLESTKEKSRSMITKASSSVVCFKVKGLCNLGNTCFFNAVMQNLSQSHSLESLLMEKTEKGRGVQLPGHTVIDVEIGGSSEEDEEDMTVKGLSSIDIVPSEAGPLTQSLLGFLQDMNRTGSKSSGSNNIVNPSPIFGQICKKAPRFKGFQQQDSHELLRYLLDVIRTEEIKRCQTGILKKFNVNIKTVNDDTKMKVKEYGRQAKHTFIDSLFGGQLVSTVMCEECKHISQIFEPFLDLSLPVTEEKPSRPNSMMGTKKKSMDEGDDSQTKAVDGFSAKEKLSKQPSKKEKRMSKKEQRRKDKLSRKINKQDDPVFNDIIKDANPEEGKGSDDGPISDGRISESADNVEKEEKEDDHENSDADIEDNLESDASKLFGGSSTTVSLQGQDNIISDDITAPSIGSSNNLIALNQTNPELQNGLTVIETLQCTPIVRTDNDNDSNIDADSSSVTLVDNESSTLFTSTESSLTPSTTGSSYKTKSTDSSRSSTCDIKDTFDGNCLRSRLSESLNELNLEDSRSRLGATGNDLVPDVNKNLNYLNLDVGHYTANTDNIPYIDAVESPDNTEAPSLPSVPQEDDTSATVDCNGTSRRNSAPQKAQALRKEAQYKSMSTLSERYHSVGKECSIASCLHQFTSAELLTGSNKVICDNCTRIKMKKLPNKDKKKSDNVCSNANKQYLIFQPPAVLTLHLKRFEQIGFASRKVNRHVDFPLLLDLAPYCSSLCQGIQPGQKKIIYSLYGVVEHSGRLSGGHYTAFVKVRPNMNSVVSFIHPNFTFPKEYISRYVEQSLNGPKAPDIDIGDNTIESLVPPGKWYHISDSHVHEVSESSVLHAQAYLLFYERIY